MQNITVISPLNLQRPNTLVIGHAKQDDFKSRWYRATLLSGDTEWTPPTGSWGTIRFHKPDGHGGWYDQIEGGSQAVTWNGSTVTMGMAEQVLTCPGDVKIDLMFSDASGSILTAFTWTLRVEKNAIADAVETSSEDYFTILAGQVAAVARTVADAERIASGVTQPLAGRNLLTNWDWRRAVNQRGISSSTATDYTWALDMCRHLNGTLSVSNGTWTWASARSAAYKRLQLRTGGWYYRGLTYTLTIYARATAKSGNVVLRPVAGLDELQGGAGVQLEESSTYRPYTVTFSPTESTENAFVEILCGNSASDYVTIDISCWKLEVGSEQTLARQAGGGWVINEPPADYATEQLKCQRYYIPLFGASRTATGNGPLVHALTATLAETVIPLPTTMVSTDFRVGASSLVLRHGISDVNVSSVSVEWTPLGARLQLQVASGLTAGDTYIVRANGGYLDLLAG